MDYIIQGAPDKIQFAKDGKYENAWVTRINDGRPTDEEIQGYLEREDFEDLIVEYLWRSHDGENANVVTLFHNDNLLVENRFDFMNLAFDAFYEYRNFGDYVNFIDKRVIGFDFLFKVPVDIVRAGVLNHWFSVGPVDLWRRGEAVPDAETIKQKIAANPNLTPSQLNFQSLAFIFNFDKKLRGPYHVIKAPISRKTEKGWEIDMEKTAEQIKNWLKIFNKQI